MNMAQQLTLVNGLTSIGSIMAAARLIDPEVGKRTFAYHAFGMYFLTLTFCDNSQITYPMD